MTDRAVADAWVNDVVRALGPLADPTETQNMQWYMKDVSPFLGIRTPQRRAVVRSVAATHPRPTSAQLRLIATELWAMDQREYQYVAYDLLARFQRDLPASFLKRPVQQLLTTKPWWDTVDGLVTAAVAPLTQRFPALVKLMWTWERSGNTWLIRAAIGHQRGRKADTDIDLLIALCEPHASDREFFVAKAVGWALRDVAPYFPHEVRSFVEAHPQLSRVARVEAVRGLVRAGA